MNIGDVVQLNPKLDKFGGCFMIVTEPKSWGAQGYVTVPGKGIAFYRANTEDMVKIGEAQWMQDMSV